MASTQLTVDAGIKNGATTSTPQAIDSTNGNKIPYANNMIIRIAETGGTNPITPSIATDGTNPEGKSGEASKEISADGSAFFGPFDEDFNQGGFLEITYTGTGTGTVEAYRPAA